MTSVGGENRHFDRDVSVVAVRTTVRQAPGVTVQGNLPEHSVVIIVFSEEVSGTLVSLECLRSLYSFSSTRRSQTHGSATNKTEYNTHPIMYSAPLAHQEPSILPSFSTFSSVRMTERRYQLTLPARRNLRSWDLRVPVSLEHRFPTICGEGPRRSH